MEDKDYCVYTHNDDDGNIRYVGNGRLVRAYNRRAKSKRGKRYEQFVITNGKLSVVVVKDGLTKEEAIELERILYENSNKELLLNTKIPNYIKSTDSIDFNHYFHYDETSPSYLRWTENAPRKRANLAAGYITNLGYYQVSLNGIHYSVHRIIYELIHGKFDKFLVIDHIDNNKLNNSIGNLRLVTNAENARNKILTNRDGLPSGVNFHKRDMMFVASISHPTIKTNFGQPKRICKYFSINKYGYEEALRLAIEARLKMLEDIEQEYGVKYLGNHKPVVDKQL